MKLDVQEIISKIKELPILPGTTIRLVKVLTNPKATVKQVVEIIQYDQNLTAEVLRLCNSAYFGLSRKVTTLKDAITYLGSRQVLQLVFSIHCRSTLMGPQPGYGLTAGMLWEHSIACAIGAEKIAQKKHRDLTGVAFTAGLLHDIGKVVLDQALTVQYKEVLKYTESFAVPFQDAEREVLGISHEEVGGMITEYWRLPEPIPSSCKFHHKPQEYTGNDETTRHTTNIVHLADSIVISMGIGAGIDGLQYAVDSALAQEYGVENKSLDRLSAELLTEFEKLKELYNNRR